jgi:hypothetical protein
VKLSLLIALLATSVSAMGVVYWPGRSAVIPPPPGKYTGVLTVHRTLIQEGLETSFTVKVDASVAADGQVTILTATPESPGAAANIENSVVRAAPRPLLLFPIGVFQPAAAFTTTGTVPASPVPTNTPVGGVVITGPVATLPTNPAGTLSFSNYLVNGSIPASLTVAPRMVYLSYALTQYRPLTLTLSPGATGSITAPGPITAAGSLPVAPGAVALPPSSDITLPSVPTGNILQQTPTSRVSYDFVLRYQRPVANAAKAPAPVGR